MNRRVWCLSLSLAVFAVQPLLAATYYVGSCKSGSYSTIQSAVNAVPSGSTIQVCAGAYYEQVVISKPLTLEAIPGVGPVEVSDVGVSLATTTSIYWSTVAPQIQITAGPVNISNINVFEGNPTGCPATEIAIFYGSGSSGSVNGVLTNGNCNFGSVGVAAENGNGNTESVTIENSEIHAGSNAGIAAGSSQEPTSSLTAVVKNNTLWTNGIGIMSLGNLRGSISGNFIASAPAGGTGVWAGSCCVPVSDNSIVQQNIGIDIEGTLETVRSNHIFASQTTGINIGIGDVTVQDNGISYTLNSAIEFNCQTGNTVSGNVVINAPIGLDKVPTGFTGSNVFFNVGKRRTDGC